VGGPGVLRDESEKQIESVRGFWPFESTRYSDGSTAMNGIPFYSFWRNSEGEKGFHLLNYIQGPGVWALLPLAYSLDSPEGKYAGIVPVYFQGPEHWVAPPLLSASWEREKGGRSTWITPLYHRTLDEDGKASFHFLNFYKNEDSWFIYPLLYGKGERGSRSAGVVPFYFQGPGWWFVPLLLTGSQTLRNEGRTTWLTPLFHYTSRKEKKHSFHVANYFQGPGYKAFFPIFYTTGESRNRRWGIVPFFMKGRDSWFAPPLLSWSRGLEDGGRSTWVTPLFHHLRDGEGRERFHAANYFQGPDHNVFFPLFWAHGEPGKKHVWVVPFYYQGPDYKILFPIAYMAGEPGRRSFGLLPFYVQTRNSVIVPPLLFGSWKRDDGGRSSWFTPFFHLTRDGKNDVWFHFLNYLQGPGYKLFLPLAYSVGGSGNRYAGVVPLYFHTPRSWYVPLLLSWSKGFEDGARSIWLTPLFRYHRDGQGDVRFSFLNYSQGPDHHFFHPLVYLWGKGGIKNTWFPPFYLQGPGYFFVPPLLSGGWGRADGGRSIWITPLFHQTRDGSEKLVSRHLLNWIEWPDFKAFLPLYWNWRNRDGGEHSMVPILYHGFDGARGDRSRSILWPLFEYRKSSRLDDSILLKMRPFLYQRGGDDMELNLLWNLLFHLRKEGGRSEVTIGGPLWSWRRNSPDTPSEFGVLGGFLFSRVCDYEEGTYRYKLFGFLPVSSKKSFSR